MQYEKDIEELSYPFKELFSTSTIIFYHCKLEEDLPLLFISDNVTELLGYTPDEFEQNNSLWMDSLHPEDREKVLAHFDEIYGSGSFVIEFRFKHKKGNYIWLRDEVKLVYNDANEPESIVGCSIDITSRKKAEEKVQRLNNTLEQRIAERTNDLTVANRKLKEQIQYHNKAKTQLDKQQKKLKLLEMAVANINDMVIITKAPVDDPIQSEIKYVNRAFEKFTGYKLKEIKNKRPVFLHGNDTSPQVLQYIEQRIEQHKPLRVEFVNYRKDGSKYWVELDMAPFPAEEDDYEYWVGINRDITQRKEAELTLEENEHRYRAYSELSFDAIFEITLDGTITDCNRRACEMFGYSRNELVGMNTLELTPKEYKSSQPEIISEEVTTGHSAWERTYKKKDGTLFPTEISTKLYKRGGEERLIAYVRDISDHKNYEQTIKKSLKEKETLLAEIHHRVKNNLAIISGLLEMQTYKAENEEAINELRDSQSRIQSIAMVHEKLYQSESFTDIALDKYVDELLELLFGSFGHPRKNITVNKDIDAISLDVSQAVPCGLLLNELITNVFKHAFAPAEGGLLEIHLKQKNDIVEMRVKDNGKGLPADLDIEDTPTLGSTLITTLVKQLQGSLEVTSNEGNGTEFIVTFELEM